MDEKKNPYHKEFGFFSNAKFVMGSIWKYNKIIYFILLLMIVVTPVLNYGWSFLTKFIIDTAVGKYTFELKEFLIVIGSIGGVFLVSQLLQIYGNYGNWWRFVLVRMKLTSLKNLKAMKIDYYHLEDTNLLDCFQKASNTCAGDGKGIQGMMETIFNFVVTLSSVVTGLVILTSLNPIVVAVLVCISIIGSLFSNYTNKKAKKKVWDVLAPWWRKNNYMSYTATDFSAAKDIRMFSLKDWLIKKQEKLNEERLAKQKLNEKIWFANSTVSNVLWFLAKAGVYAWLLYSVILQKIDVGSFSLYLTSATIFFSNVNQITSKISDLFARSREVDDFRSFLVFDGGDGIIDNGERRIDNGELKIDNKVSNLNVVANGDGVTQDVIPSDGTSPAVILSERSESKNLKRPLDYARGDTSVNRGNMGVALGDKDVPKAEKYEFEFQNVSFKYPNSEKYALKNLSITVKGGERLAVVGLNGAGKSTFIKLLLRLYKPTEGRILMNGIDIQDFDREKYFEIFAPLFQDVVLFAFPMSQNVSLKFADETDKNLAEKVLRNAGLSEKIDELPNGVETQMLKVVYDDGVDLSGGEKQKLALARALYKNSPVVVLDEPTAALDAIAESKLYNDFDKLIGGKTAIYISHRLSSTQFCNNVAMFKDGELCEYGTHQSLLAKGGEYAEMWHVQAQYYRA